MTLETVRGRREQSEHVAKYIRQCLAQWKGEDAARGGRFAKLRSALFWSVTERWAARMEALAAALEQQAVTLRAEETRLAAEHQRPWVSRIFE